MKYKLGARRLEKVIEQVYGIHKFLLKEGLAKGRTKKEEKEKTIHKIQKRAFDVSILTGSIDALRKSLQQENSRMLTPLIA
ncbi:hypothetical protein DRP04_04610 [Archaeoglobales archaeon]|nr:MAG: hypothetical protein DRP04_04610 [Archaeoglobales archaeon]